jgi:hypothetical protein
VGIAAICAVFLYGLVAREMAAVLLLAVGSVVAFFVAALSVPYGLAAAVVACIYVSVIGSGVLRETPLVVRLAVILVNGTIRAERAGTAESI